MPSVPPLLEGVIFFAFVSCPYPLKPDPYSPIRAPVVTSQDIQHFNSSMPSVDLPSLLLELPDLSASLLCY